MSIVGGYALIEPIGAGGFGEVWRARASSPAEGKPAVVALKLATSKRGAEALRREGAIQSRLDHPGIVKVVEMGLAAESPWIAFEYFRGGNLRQVVDAIPDDDFQRPARVREIFAALAEALAHAHERGFVHGDLKPENVVFDAAGRPAITDFGLGTSVAGGSVELSRSLASVALGGGTLAYLAPERHQGSPATPAGDVWAFGIMLFEAVFRRLPQGLEPTHWPLGPLFGRCYAPAARRIPDGATLVRALEVGAARVAPRGRAPSEPRSGPTIGHGAILAFVSGALVVLGITAARALL